METGEYLKYYPELTLKEEIKKTNENYECEDYLTHGFRVNKVSNLIKKYFNIDNPVMDIQFST